MKLVSDKYKVLENPELDLVVSEFNKLKRTHVINLFLNCMVEYKGRAKSYLDWGDKLIISKPDGTLMVHGKIKREPINWQPPGSTAITYTEEELLVIRSTRLNPKEILIIKSPMVYLFTAFRMDLTRFMLWDSEADMVKYVMENPDVIERGLEIIKREVQTPYGNIDLLATDKDGNLVIMEFKRSTAQLDAISQLKRYFDYFKSLGHENVRGILIAPGITQSAQRLLKQYGLEFKQMSPYVDTRRPSIQFLK